MLKDDHKTIERLFKQYEQAGERAYAEKRNIVDRIVEELSVHAVVEELIFYPFTRETVPAVHDVALESLEEHHIVKWELSELQRMDPRHERFDAKVKVLIENVRHHVQEEEGEYFPAVRAELGTKVLNEVGDAMVEAKRTAPTHPHPRSPDTPPGNVVAGAVAAVVDRVSDTVSGVAQGTVTATQEAVDRVRGKKRTRPSPRGPKRARAVAGTVRGSVDETLDRLIATAKEAKESSEDTAKTTARSASKSAAATRSAAKGSGQS